MSKQNIYFLVMDHLSKAGILFIDDNESSPTIRQGAVNCVEEQRNG